MPLLFGPPSAGGDYHSMALAIKERVQSRRQTERSKFDYALPNAYLGLPTRQAQASRTGTQHQRLLGHEVVS